MTGCPGRRGCAASSSVSWRRSSVLFVIAPLAGSGVLCLKLGVFAPIVVALFHVAYGAILGLVYGKLLDTDEAHYAAHH